MSLLMFFLLHQIVLVYGKSRNYVTIIRTASLGKEGDSFDFIPEPHAWPACRYQKPCNSFHANLSPNSFKLKGCVCSCSSDKAATFGIKNGSWKCIGNKEIRDKELDDCKIINFIDEKDTDPLRMFKIEKRENSAALNISNNAQCSEKMARFKYQECNGGWKSPHSTATAWGLEVTENWSSSDKNYMLKIKTANQSKELDGKVIKLVIPCVTDLEELEFCLLFKVAGRVICPYKPNLATIISSTQIMTTTAATATATAATTTTAHSISTKHTILTTKVPITTISLTHKANNPWITDKDFEKIQEASHELSIPLITGTVGSAVIVLLVAVFVGWLKCRKRKDWRKSSTSLELNVTKTDDSTDQYAVVQEKAPYQSLTPLPDGAMERGVYVPRYKVPETYSDETNNSLSSRDLPEGREPCRPVTGLAEKPSCDEYDYAESCLVMRNNVLKSSFPVSNEEAPNTAEDNAPFYHILAREEEGLPNKGPSEGACRVPEERAPYYRVLEEPNPLDPNFYKGDNEGAYDAPREVDPYYQILEESVSMDRKDVKQKGPSDVTRPDCGYKELQPVGRVYTGYQALHRYAM